MGQTLSFLADNLFKEEPATPIQKKRYLGVSSSLFDPRSPSEGVSRTPIQFPGPVHRLHDPRSPSNGIDRTPIIKQDLIVVKRPEKLAPVQFEENEEGENEKYADKDVISREEYNGEIVYNDLVNEGYHNEVEESEITKKVDGVKRVLETREDSVESLYQENNENEEMDKMKKGQNKTEAYIKEDFANVNEAGRSKVYSEEMSSVFEKEETKEDNIIDSAKEENLFEESFFSLHSEENAFTDEEFQQSNADFEKVWKGNLISSTTPIHSTNSVFIKPTATALVYQEQKGSNRVANGTKESGKSEYDVGTKVFMDNCFVTPKRSSRKPLALKNTPVAVQPRLLMRKKQICKLKQDLGCVDKEN